jgi:hypothetical protein
MMDVNFPSGVDLGSATVRGASILAIYRRLSGDLENASCEATAAELIADVMAAVQSDAGWRLAAAADSEDMGVTVVEAEKLVAVASEIFEEMVGSAIDADAAA